MSPPEEELLEDLRDKKDNIIISDSTLYKILPPKINKMIVQYKVMCGCECFISEKNMHFSLSTWCDSLSKHIKDRSHNAQNRRSGALSSCLFETHKHSVRPHGCHIYNSAAYMNREKFVPIPHNIMVYHTGNTY